MNTPPRRVLTASGANVGQKQLRTKKIADKIRLELKDGLVNGFLGDIGSGILAYLTNLLGLQDKGASRYREFILEDGSTLTVWVSNHAAKESNFVLNGDSDRNLSLVISRHRPGVLGGNEWFEEYWYDRNEIEGPRGKEVVRSILRGVAGALETGRYIDLRRG